MISNFELEDNIAIKFDGRYIDLHNNFDFIGYEYDISIRQIILKWTKSKGDWVQENEFNGLQLIHRNVSFLTISYDNIQYEFPDDDKCLSFISFFPSIDRLTNNGFIEQPKPSEADDIIYSFETEHFIRVGCDKIELICQ
jgi:hypothetical protein